MRIIAGTQRGRALRAPPGTTTRPTADRARQAIFDMLLHAPWGGKLDERHVLDAFAGTGAMGLEALSRGAASAVFMEQDRAALAALTANIAACQAGPHSQVLATDTLRPPPPTRPSNLIFLDPPYGQNLVARALTALQTTGWIAPNALIIAETSRTETLTPPPQTTPLAERSHGAARVTVLRWN